MEEKNQIKNKRTEIARKSGANWANCLPGLTGVTSVPALWLAFCDGGEKKWWIRYILCLINWLVSLINAFAGPLFLWNKSGDILERLLVRFVHVPESRATSTTRRIWNYDRKKRRRETNTQKIKYVLALIFCAQEGGGGYKKNNASKMSSDDFSSWNVSRKPKRVVKTYQSAARKIPPPPK